MPKFLQRRGKLSKRSGGDGALVSQLLRAATLRSKQSLCELEASWSFRGDTGTARRAPRLVLRSILKKKEREPKIYPESTSNPRTLRYQKATESEARQVQRRVEPPSPKLFLRFAPKAALMASVLGNNSRASGAQSGQVKCKLKRRRRRRSKRKGTTLQLLFVLLLHFLHSVSRDRAHLGEHLSARPGRPRTAPPFRTATPRRCSSANLEYSETTFKNDSYLDVPSA